MKINNYIFMMFSVFIIGFTSAEENPSNAFKKVKKITRFEQLCKNIDSQLACYTKLMSIVFDECNIVHDTVHKEKYAGVSSRDGITDEQSECINLKMRFFGEEVQEIEETN